MISPTTDDGDDDDDDDDDDDGDLCGFFCGKIRWTRGDFFSPPNS